MFVICWGEGEETPVSQPCAMKRTGASGGAGLLSEAELT